MNSEEESRLVEQERVDQVSNEIDKKMAELTSKGNLLRKDVVDLRKDFWDDVTINLDNTDEAIETHASIKQQAEFLSERERSHGQIANQLKVLEDQKRNPYFGRIDFLEDGEKQVDPIYIGLASLMDQKDEDFLIYDWRAPISSMYYDYSLGEASYETLDHTITGEISLKRQFIIKRGIIDGMFDTGITIGDGLLQEALGNNASSIMQSIVATIQQEQNRIIRNESSKYLVVQGVAGSGKTSAALQRVAYLMYRHREVLHADNMVLFSPNALFNSYVSHVLPELGEVNMRQTTFQSYLNSKLAGEFTLESPLEQMEYMLTSKEDEAYKIKRENISLKSSGLFKQMMDEYLASLEEEGILFMDILFRDVTLITAEEISEQFYALIDEMPLANAMEHVATWMMRQIDEYQEEEKTADWVMDEVELLDEEAYLEASQYAQEQEEHDDFYSSNIEEEYLREEVVEKAFTPLRDKIEGYEFIQVLETYKNLFAKWNPQEVPPYWSEIGHQTIQELARSKMPWEDATPFVYFKGRLLGDTEDRSVRYLFIDEAQDYTAFQLAYIKHIFPYTRITFLGDINQTIYAHTKEGNPLQAEFEESYERIALTKSYRSTKQIVDFTKHFSPDAEKIQSFEREGSLPQVMEVENKEELDHELSNVIEQLKERGNEMIAIIGKTFSECEALYNRLKDKVEVTKMDETASKLEQGVIILPIYLAKGIEFDAVIIPDASKRHYVTELDQSLFYTACTRAMHDLTILSVGESCSFIQQAPDKTYERK